MSLDMVDAVGIMTDDRLAMCRDKLTRLIGNQSELARRTGIPQSTISKILSGDRRPFADQLFAIARALDVPIEYLLDDEKKSPPRPLSDEEGRIIDLIRLFDLAPEVVAKAIADLVRRGDRSLPPGKTIGIPGRVLDDRDPKR